MPFPFEVSFEEVEAYLDMFVDAVFGALRSEFLTMPKGDGFVEYPVFEHGYETLKRTTSGFRNLRPETAMEAVYQAPIALIVLRTMLGFTPPEWAEVTTRQSDVTVTQNAARISIGRFAYCHPDSSRPPAAPRTADSARWWPRPASC